MTETKWFNYIQNNTGGRWDKYVKIYVEAIDYKHANSIVTELDEVDVYFDGCDLGIDCSCCGDRWYPNSEWDTGENCITDEEKKYSIEYANVWGLKCLVVPIDKENYELS